MNMKEHIISALREQFNSFDELLVSMSEEQITSPDFDLNWSLKDIMNHLWGWQQVSIVRVNAGVLNREPEFPNWLMKCPGGWDEDTNQTNAWIYQCFHDQSWTEVHKKWRDGFLQLLDLSEELSEKDLLDGDTYSWLNGYSLAFILIASYEHHQEHLDALRLWHQEQENKG